MQRWYVYDGRQILLDIGTFLEYRESELLRSVSVAIDMRLMTPLSGSISALANPVPIATLTSDIEVALTFGFDFSNVIYWFGLMTKNIGDVWSLVPINSSSHVLLDTDTIQIIRVTRSIADPTQIWVWANQVAIVSGEIVYYSTVSEDTVGKA